MSVGSIFIARFSSSTLSLFCRALVFFFFSFFAGVEKLVCKLLGCESHRSFILLCFNLSVMVIALNHDLKPVHPWIEIYNEHILCTGALFTHNKSKNLAFVHTS